MRQARAGHDTCGQRVTPRCRWAAGPGRTTSRRAERSSRRGRLTGGSPPTGTHSDQAPQVWRAPEGPEGTGGLRDNAPRHTPACQSPPMWRAPEGPEGLAAVPVGGGGAWPGFEMTRRATDQRPGTTGVEGAGGSGGHGRASRSTTPSEARVWRSRGRPGPTAPGTPVGLQATPRGADGSRAGRRRRAHRAARSRGRDLRRLEHPWGHKQPGSTQQRARSAAAPRAPHVCQWLTG